MQVLEAFGPRIAGVHASDDTVADATRLIVAFAEPPLYAAVSVSLWLLLIVVVVVLNVAVVAPAATVTDAGTVNSALVSLRVTAAPPAGAACVNVTVQVLVAFCPKLVGLHASDDTVTGATRLIVAFAEPPLYVAVTVAVWLLLMVPAVAVKVAEVSAARIVTVAGTVKAALLLLSVTDAPPVRATLARITVQVDFPALLRLVGIHAIDEIVGKMAPPVTVPPVAFSTMAPPAVEEATLLLIPIAVVLTPVAIARLIVASVPFAIMPAFNPEARQV